MEKWPRTYAVFDIETDGLNVETCMPTEVSLLWCVDGQLKGLYESLIWRTDPIPERITQITGITLELCQRDGKPLSQVFNVFWSYAQHFPLLGHNIWKFDLPIVRRFLPPWAKADVPFVDTTHLYRHYKRSGRIEWPPQKEMERMMNSAGRERFKYNLRECCSHFDLLKNMVEGHRATVDAMNNQVLYEEMRKRAVDVR